MIAFNAVIGGIAAGQPQPFHEPAEARPLWKAKSQPTSAGAVQLNHASGETSLRVVQPGTAAARPSRGVVLKWRRPDAVTSDDQPAAERLQSGVWRDRDTKLHSAVRTVNYEEEANPFADPFGDRLAQGGGQFGNSAAAQPGGRDSGFQPVDPTPLSDSEQPPLFDTPIDQGNDSATPPTELPAFPSLDPGTPIDPQNTQPSMKPAPPQTEPGFSPPDAAPVPPAKSVAPKKKTTPVNNDPISPKRIQPIPDPASPRSPDSAPLPPFGDYGSQEEPCKRIYNGRNCCDEDEKCKSARQKLYENPISAISLDITAPFKPDAVTYFEEQEARADQIQKIPARVWRNRDGEIIASGKVTDIKNRKVEIRSEDNRDLVVPLGNLSDDDWCFLAAWWGVPTECSLGDEQYAARKFEPMTFTWKASGLCHKPLYFEETQLERYGHTMGPFLQPVVSGAHFFGSVLVLPYQMGINPPNECRYTLGYYRPGNCAPWLLPPVPLSGRGALYQTGAVLGGIFLIP